MAKFFHYAQTLFIVSTLISKTTANITSVINTDATQQISTATAVAATAATSTVAGDTRTTASRTTASDKSQDGQYDRNTTTGGQVAKIPLYIGGFYSSGDRWDGAGVLPIVQLALDHVNNNPNILEEYELEVIWKNTMCYSADAVWAFHRHLVEEPTKIILLGPACSPEAETVSEVGERGNLVTLSYSASSDQLSNKELYPYFFRTYKSESDFNTPTRWLLEYFNWRRVGAFTENHDLFVLKTNQLIDQLQKANITVETHEIFTDMVTQRQIQDAKEHGIKVFIATQYEDKARQLFCLIYKNKMYGDGYVWIIPGWYSERWWWSETAVDGCTAEEIAVAVEESFYIGPEQLQFTKAPNEKTVAGITGNEYLAQVEQLDLSNVTISGLEPFAYDAVWALALALNQSAEILAEDGIRLEDFTYDSTKIGKAILKAMNSTKFSGMSGPISFPFGDTFGTTILEQLQAFCPDGWDLYNASCYKYLAEDVKAQQTAKEHCKNSSFNGRPQARHPYLASILSNEEVEFLTQLKMDNEWYDLSYNHDQLFWVDANGETNHLEDRDIPTRCRGSPRNGRDTVDTDSCKFSRDFICKVRADFKEFPILSLTTDEKGTVEPRWEEDQFIWPNGEVPLDRIPAVEEGLSHQVYIVIVVLASLGMVSAFVFLTFNFKARNRRYVKLSSPQLKNLIIIGCILIYLSVFIMGTEVVGISNTKARWFCMTRTWLFSLGFVLGYGAILSKTWRVYKVAVIKDSGVKRIKILDSQLFKIVSVLLLVDGIILLLWTLIDSMKHEVVVLSLERYVTVCSCRYFTLWAVLLLLYKATLLLFGVFLAWQTRKAVIPAMNDSKLIGFCIYNTSLLSVIGVGVGVALTEKQGLQHTFTALIIVFCATFTLVVVFVPKMVHLRKYPNEDRKISNIPPLQTPTTTSNSTSDSSLTPPTTEMETGKKGTVIYHTNDISIIEEELASEKPDYDNLDYNKTSKTPEENGYIDKEDPSTSPGVSHCLDGISTEED